MVQQSRLPSLSFSSLVEEVKRHKEWRASHSHLFSLCSLSDRDFSLMITRCASKTHTTVFNNIQVQPFVDFNYDCSWFDVITLEGWPLQHLWFPLSSWQKHFPTLLLLNCEHEESLFFTFLGNELKKSNYHLNWLLERKHLSSKFESPNLKTFSCGFCVSRGTCRVYVYQTRERVTLFPFSENLFKVL
jgi:hypothetical protein